MTTPAAANSDQPGPRPSWLVLTASERGASHIAMQTPNQDSVASERAGATGMVAAVADGHGHTRHLRSARGSRFAVAIGCQAAQELADLLEGDEGPLSQHAPAADTAAAAGKISGLLEEFLVPAIVERWREAVLADVAGNPFTDAEQDQRQRGDDPTIAYGSTLLLGITLHDWLILAQIGDGDVVGVRADGGEVLPVPVDPQLNGLVTTSLCGANARDDFRVAVVDTASTPLLAVLLATDGYGNAQVVDEWPRAFSQDLAWMLRDRDAHWLAAQLPLWAARCASAEGSADDTTVALLLSPAAAAAKTNVMSAPGGHAGDPVSEETTIPAFPHSQTVPSGVIVAGQHPVEPVTTRLPAVPAHDAGDAADDALAGEAAEDEAADDEAADDEAADDAATSEWAPPDPGAGIR
jgi:Protein phosphatase 2C